MLFCTMKAMHLRMNLIEPEAETFDDEGIEVPDLDTARAYAVEAARDIMAFELRDGRPLDLNRHIDVTSEAGNIVLSVWFSEAVNILR